MTIAGQSRSFAKMRDWLSNGNRRGCEHGPESSRGVRLLLFLLIAVTVCHGQAAPPGTAQEGDPAAQSSSPAQFLPQASSSSQSSPKAQTPETASGNADMPGVEAFAGSKVTGIRFDGVKASMLGPLTSQLDLQLGDVLTESKVRESLRRLYESGLYDTIQVQGLRSEGGVVVVFTGRPRLFLGRTQFFGIKDQRLEGQLAGSARLQPGTRYTQRKLDASEASIEQVLTDSGFYEAKVERREQLDAPNSQVNIIYNIQPGRQARVGNVKVDGTPGMSLEQFRKTSKLKAGSKVNRQTVTRALTRLRKYYDKKKRWAGSVTLENKEYHANTNQLDYSFRAREGPLVKVQIEGARYSRKTIERLVPVYEEGTVDLDLVNEGARNLRSDLQGKGYFDATVTHEPVHNSADEVTVLYKVDRDVEHRVDSVRIEGNKYFDTDTLEEHISVRPANFIERHGTYSRARLDSDVDNLTALYQGSGFSNVVVTPKITDIDSRGKRGKASAHITVVYKIEEGTQQKIGSYVINGMHKIPEETLRPSLNTEVGQPYSSLNVTGDRDLILGYYLSHGYQNAQVIVEQRNDPKHPELVDVTMNVDEGQQVFVNKVLVSGLHYVRPTVVTPRVTVRPGQPLDQSALLDSQRKLYNLALFNEVDTAVQNPSADQPRKNVLLLTTEAKRWDITYGFGIQAQTGTPYRSTPSAAYLIQQGINPSTFNSGANGHFGVSPNVIFDLSRINLFGTNQSVSLRTQYGALEQQAIVLYQYPELFKTPNFTGSVSGGYTSSQNVTTFSASSLFATARITHHVTKPTTLIYSWSYREVKVDPASIQVSLALIPLLSQPARIGGPGMNYIRDTRDDPLDAHHGTFNTVALFLADSKFGSQANFSRIDLTNSNYYDVGKRHWVLARQTRYAQERAFGSGQQLLIPLPERLYAGGATSHRGFAINAAGPRDPETGYPLGGAGAMVNTFEVRTPYPNLPLVGNNLGLVLFHDMGNVFNKSDDVFPSFINFHQPNERSCRTVPTVSTNPDGSLNVTEATPPCSFKYWSHALGLGARYRTPIGPIRVDMSYNLNPPWFPEVYDYQSSVSNVPHPKVGRAGHFNFFFSIGQTF
jgi:outer membrane protein assembly factor BamA